MSTTLSNSSCFSQCRSPLTGDFLRHHSLFDKQREGERREKKTGGWHATHNRSVERGRGGSMAGAEAINN